MVFLLKKVLTNERRCGIMIMSGGETSLLGPSQLNSPTAQGKIETLKGVDTNNDHADLGGQPL